MHSNTLAVGSPYRKGRFAAEGVIAVYERENEDQLFYFHSHLRNRDGKASDRLGMSVSIEDKTLVASYHEEFPQFNWRIRKSVQSITTSAASQISGFFYATWRVQQKSHLPWMAKLGEEVSLIYCLLVHELRLDMVAKGQAC